VEFRIYDCQLKTKTLSALRGTSPRSLRSKILLWQCISGPVGVVFGSDLWETRIMPKRKLQIVKRVRNTPVLAICQACNAQFEGDPARGNAQSAIQGQFNVHKCNPLKSS
jgi:hypothetical protein